MPDENLELRSELVQDIIGHVPHWIIRWGITVILLVILALLALSWIFKYPDVISSAIVITTAHPPATIVPKTGGKIEHLFVRDNQRLREGDILAVIANPGKYQDVAELKKQLEAFGKSVSGLETASAVMFGKDYRLGELQPAYNSFLKCCADCQLFLELDYHHKKMRSIEEQVEKHERSYKRALKQLSLLKQQVRLSKNQYDRYSLEENRAFIARRDIESLESSLLQQRHSVEGAESGLDNMKIQKSELLKSILDLRLQYQEQKRQLKLELNEAYDNLTSQIRTWEHNYVLMTPVSGTVTFTKYWSENQHVSPGDAVMTVVPDAGAEIIGRVLMPVQGAGKVKPGQKMIIRFASYPQEEYGTVRGEVRQISLIPEAEHYAVTVKFPKGLKSSYGKELPFRPKMQGTAEIITEDIRLLERVFNSVRSLLKKHVQE